MVKIHISGNSRNEVEKVLTLLEPALHGERVKIVEKSPFIHAYVTPNGRENGTNGTPKKKTNKTSIKDCVQFKRSQMPHCKKE